MPTALPPDAKGILPDRMIAAMADAGAILPAYPFVESQIQPASLDLRLGDVAYPRARELSARPRRHRRRAHRRPEAARDQPRRRRGAGDQLRLHRAADRKPGAAAEHRRRRQSEKLDRPARRVHPRDRRRHAPLRHDRCGLSRAALCRDQSEDVSGAAARRLAAVADPFPPGRGRARRRSARGAACAERLVDSDDADLVERRSRSASICPARARTASSATAPSATPASSMSIAAPATRSRNSGSRSRRARTRA